jgi:hypothetical protein
MAEEYWRRQKYESDLSVSLHHGGLQRAKPKAEVIADILTSIRERKS